MGFKLLPWGGESEVVKVYPRKREHHEQKPETKKVKDALGIRKKCYLYYVLSFYRDHALRETAPELNRPCKRDSLLFPLSYGNE